MTEFHGASPSSLSSMLFMSMFGLLTTTSLVCTWFSPSCAPNLALQSSSVCSGALRQFDCNGKYLNLLGLVPWFLWPRFSFSTSTTLSRSITLPQASQTSYLSTFPSHSTTDGPLSLSSSPHLRPSVSMLCITVLESGRKSSSSWDCRCDIIYIGALS